MLQDHGSKLFRVAKKKIKSSDKNIISIMKALNKLDGTVAAIEVEVDGSVDEADLIRLEMTPYEGKKCCCFLHG
jgi:hypothetical protein